MSIVNSWILYRKSFNNMPLVTFKAHIVSTLLQIGKTERITPPRKGRPTSQQPKQSQKRY